MSDGLLNRLETAQDERDYYKARLAEAEQTRARELKPYDQRSYDRGYEDGKLKGELASEAKIERLEARLAEVVAALAGVLPDGIEDTCDECGGDEAQCPKDCCIRIGKGVLQRAAVSASGVQK